MITKQKKPFYKKWWVWAIAVILLLGIISSMNDNSQQKAIATNSEPKQTTTPTPTITTTPTEEIAPTETVTVTPTKQPIASSIKGSTNSDDNTIVYYVSGSKVYHLSKTDSTLRKSKNILSMTLKEALEKGMHQSRSKADN